MKLFLRFALTAWLLSPLCLPAQTANPTNLAELNRWYIEPPVSENAAPKVLQAIAALQISETDTNSTRLPLIGKLEMPAPDQPIPTATRAALKKFVEANRASLSLFAEAAARPQSRYPIDLNYGMATLLPHLPKFKTAARFLELAAVSAALEGRQKEATDTLTLSFALGDSLRAEPVVISQLMRAASDFIALNALEQVLNRTRLSASGLEQLQQILAPLEQNATSGSSFTRSLTGERVWAISSFEMPPEDYLVLPANVAPEERPAWLAKIKTALEADQKHTTAAFDQALALRDQPFPERLKQGELFQQAAVAATNNNYRLSQLILSAERDIASQEARALAQLRLAQTVVALERYRLAQQQYPATLSALTPTYLPTVPADPFDGQPLRYRLQNGGYVLYSLGKNLSDENGLRAKKESDGDVVFSVTPPKK